MKTSRVKLKLFLISIIILSASLIINFLLNISSFEEVFRTSIISKYIFINRNLTKKIETAINLGKPLYKFNGIEVFFDEILKNESDISNVFISSAEGKVYYSYDENYVDKYIIDTIIPSKEDGKIKVTNINTQYYICSAVYSEDKKIEGYTFIEFNKKIISNKVFEMIEESLDILSVNLSISIIFLVVFMAFLKGNHDKKKKKRNFTVILLIFITSQIIYSYININFFENKYITLLDTNIDYFSKSLNNEIDYYTNLGLKVDKLKGFEKYLANELLEVSEAEGVYITDENFMILYSADYKGNSSSIYDTNAKQIKLENLNNKYYKKYKIGNEKYTADIAIHLNEKLINKKIIELMLDTGTMLIISIIISYQMLLLSTLTRINRNKISEEVTEEEIIENEKVLIQIISFIFYFGEMMSISFMPLLIENIYNAYPVDLFGLSTDVVLGLPIATYMFGSAMSVLVIGSLSHKLSVKKIFIWCSLLLIIGGIGSAFSLNILSLSLFRLMSGVGFGGITINSTSLILKRFKRSQVAIGFGFWASGYGAASICALPIGGILVYRFGFVTALITSAFIGSLLLLFIAAFIHPLPPSEQEENKPKLKFKETINIFNDRDVFANFFFRLVPFHIVYVGIFQFMMPLFMNKEGISQADIGRILTIFGLVYLLMPIVSKLVAKFKNDRIFIAFGSLVIGSFLLILRFSGGVLGFVLVITGISLGSMIADAAEESFITSTEKAKEIGEAKFMSIYNSYERFVMVVSPVICSFFITLFGFSNGIFIIGLIIIFSAIIYLFIRSCLKTQHVILTI